ncbi:M14 family metallopeptidase [Ohtaekwangia koreensis]|uniref:Zinc carboxypeptidase n=1 Tax=Ohtaekwangia koreensis TaxID=688867 RepID=A0A1T5LIT0_9BACT|nr:M14 family metallopeptidase [Ohtaekwangia koreensis]SKC75916.1 Zinc carboxypeptidase [Ohtaekwangia koreensis]
MNKRILFFILTFISFSLQAQQKLLSPKDFLGYELGDRFTRHHRVVEYYKHVADALPNVEFYQYGETYEHRPLVYVVVTSPENFQNLEQIRLNNLKKAGMADGAPSADKKAIVWLSYNVHGNEANSTEASMQTLYELSNPQNQKTQEWLKNTVVILDPCLNPDGRDRYANFYNQYGNVPPNGSEDSHEHNEPWPGGRANHYMFDLNRDWAWGTQTETQARLKVYNQWMPHVHVDFHEQGHNHPYFFAPAAEPFHEIISKWQREFQVMIGKNNAKYFDEQGWLYFTKEVFDLYYPSYGDTYPTYSGAIGMTYEQGGQTGITISTKEGDPLTLKDRLTHHHTTGLSTVEITSINYSRVVDEFEKYFRDNLNNPASTYKTYVIKGNNNPDKIDQLAKWMDAHSIKYGYSSAGKATRGFDYQTQTTTNVSVSTDDIVINIYQPKSRFITAVFEPQSKLPDSLTYDVTAWNLMYAYNLKAYALTERINAGKAYESKVADNTTIASKPYAYIFQYQGVKDVAFLSALMQKGIKVRSSLKAFKVNGKDFDRGALIVTRRNNEKVEDFDNTVQSLAKSLDRKIYTSPTGFVESGKDFGSSSVNYVKAPNVALLFGDETSSLSTGEIWYFFEQQLHYPITTLGTDYIKYVALNKYDVLIIPEGRYSSLDEKFLEKISGWVSAGGKLIVIANGLDAFADKKGFALKPYTDDDEKEKAEKKEKDIAKQDALTRYEDADRKEISNFIGGAIYKVTLDNSHPLGFGLPATYYSLKTNELRYGYIENGWNVGVLKGKLKPVQGFAGKYANEKLANSLVFGVEQKGKGNIVYLVDNPMFRCFWEDGKMLLSNAVFLVGQ